VRCVEDHLETFIQAYEERFERNYGFFRPYLQKVIYRYLDFGDRYNGFAQHKMTVISRSSHFNSKQKSV
jgi:hypothetical protein